MVDTTKSDILRRLHALDNEHMILVAFYINGFEPLNQPSNKSVMGITMNGANLNLPFDAMKDATEQYLWKKLREINEKRQIALVDLKLIDG